MITTITPNPSIDRTLTLAALHPGDVHKVNSTTVEAGGKGINVARALARCGHATRALAVLNDDDERLFTSLLADSPLLDLQAIGGDAPVRTNITLITDTGETTKLNESGAAQPARALNELLAAIEGSCRESAWIVGAGSLPAGLDEGFYRTVATQVADHEAKFAVDASGGALEHAVRGACDLIKPNIDELSQLVASPLETLGHVVNAATEVHNNGVQTVLVSLGDHGAVLVDRHGAWHGVSPTDTVLNTVGAGDAFLAGFLSVDSPTNAGSSNNGSSNNGSSNNGANRLAEALAWGRAAVRSPTTSFPPPGPEDRTAVVISSEIDPLLPMRTS